MKTGQSVVNIRTLLHKLFLRKKDNMNNQMPCLDRDFVLFDRKIVRGI